MQSIVDYLEAQANERGDHRFLTEQGRTLSFAEVFSLVKKMARVLADNGVQKGDRVILLIEGRTHHLITYFASLSLGAIAVHLHTQRPRAFVEFAVRHTTAKIVVTENYAEGWQNFPCPILPFPTLRPNDPEAWSAERSEIAYMMFTSGTTGLPKAVMTSQANTLFTANTIIDFAQLTGSERELICLPLSFTFGLGHLHSQLILGGQAHLFAGMRDSPALLDILATDDITGFLASPGMLKIFVEQHTDAFARSARRLRYLVINCTPMPVPLTQRLLDLLPDTRIYMYYGLTEASRSAYNFYNENPNKLDCTGRATKGVALKIANPHPETGEGEVCIKGPNVMPGYWGEAKTSCIDEEGWFATGDLGVMDEDGFITVKGRVKEQISVDGMKCQPLEIETVLNQHEEVVEAAVVGLPNEFTYQTVGAAIVTHSTQEPTALIERLQQHCASHLEPFKVPKRFVFIEAVPRTELGKIKRLEIADLLQQSACS